MGFLLLAAAMIAAPLQERTNEHYARGHELLVKGDLDGAIAAFTKSIESDPAHLASFNERGIARKRKGHLQEAIADFTRAIEIDPKCAPAYSNRGDSFRILKRLDEAIKDGAKAVELEPSNPMFFYNLGLCRKEKGLLDQAVADFGKAIALQPRLARAFMERGEVKARQGKLDDALEDMSHAVKVDPKLSAAYFMRAHVWEAKQRLPEALTDLDRFIGLEPGAVAGRLKRAQVLLVAKEFERAILDCDAALKLDSKSGRAYGIKADALGSLGKFDEAAQGYSKLIELSPTAEAYLARGRCHLYRLDGAAAAADGAKALELGANPAQARLVLGWGLQLQRKFEEAIAEFDKVEKLEPKLDVYNLRGNARKRLGRFEDALKDYARIIELEPKNYVALNNRGYLLYDLERWEEALADLRKSISFQGHTIAQSLFCVWLIQARQGKKEAADEELRRVLKESKGSPDKAEDEAVSAFLLGEKSEDDLLKFASSSPDPKLTENRHVRSWYYIGWKRLLQGDAKKAEEYFKKCADSQIPLHEADSAGFQLKRMKRD